MGPLLVLVAMGPHIVLVLVVMGPHSAGIDGGIGGDGAS